MLVFAMIFSLTSFSNVSADSDRVKELPLATDNAAELTAVNAVSISEVPNNIKNLISDQNADKIILASTPEDEAEIFTLRTINSETGEGTITVHSVPIKYRDSTGKMQFIDTSMKPINTAESAQNGFIYRNAANSFLVEFGNTASKGINFNNAFTFEAKSNISSRKAEQGQAENEQGKIIYPNVFGPNTKVEYINTENGLKENIILDKYTGQNRFDFTFRSDTHIPILTENGTNILVADKNDPQKIEYRFLSLYAYDSYDPAKDPEQRDSDFRHMNEDLYYELTDNEDGTYTITVVVPEEYLTHPEIVYPVTIDPSLEPYVSSNSNAQDTFVDAATPSTQGNGNLDYIRFGKVSGYKNFGYHRFTSLPSLPQGAYATSAYLKFTFRSGQTTPSTSSGIKMRVRQITGNTWYESSITWNNKPSTGSSTSVDITYKGSYLDYFNANITSMVQAWYSGSPNYGVDFTYNNEDYNDYNSVVSSEGEAHRAPVLSINYNVPSTIPVTGVSVSPTSVILSVNGTRTLATTISPSNATNKSVTWSSSNTAVATVSSTGLVTAKSPGIATITAKTADGGKTAQCTITVNPISSSYANLAVTGDASGYFSKGRHFWYKFTPTITGNYVFGTTGSTDTYGELYQGATLLQTNDDGGDGNNFRIECNLSAGTEYRLKVRGYSTTTTGSFFLFLSKDDPNEAFDNVYTGANTATMGQTESNHKISYSTDVDWFKVSVPSSSNYRLRILLYKPDSDSGTGKAEIRMGVYSGTTADTLVGAAICHYDDRPASVTAQINNYTGNKWFYVKVQSSGGQHSKNNNYQIMFTFTDEPYGGEIYGWDYSGAKRSPTLNYRMSTGMNDVWKVENGVSVTYADLFREAVNVWNAANPKGDGTPMFGINTNPLSPNVEAKSLPSSTDAVTSGLAKDIDLNKDNFPKLTRQQAVDTICHELGHTLGLADLYIESGHNYMYTPTGASSQQLLDNSDHMMFGYRSRTNNISGTGAQRFHREDLFGVKKVQGWLSLVKYSEEELYSTADFIVRGKVKSTQAYADNELHSDLYTQVDLEVDEYLYSKSKSSEKVLSFLQAGLPDMEFSVDPLYMVGEEYVLFLHYDLYGELFVVGGPQGRFRIIEETGNTKVINQMDLYVQNTMAENYNQRKDFSIGCDAFTTTVKTCVAKQYK